MSPARLDNRVTTLLERRVEAHECARAGAAAASYGGWRERMIWGEGHDHTSWRLGGLSGNAGPFGTARDVWRCALEHLGRGRGNFPERLLPLRREDAAPTDAAGRARAWRLARAGEPSAGGVLPSGAAVSL